VIGGLLCFGLGAAAALFIRARSRRGQKIQEPAATYGPVDELDGAGVYQLAGTAAAVHQIDDSTRIPVYEVPGSSPPVYEKDAPIVSTRSIGTAKSEDNLILHNNGVPVELHGSDVAFEKDET